MTMTEFKERFTALVGWGWSGEYAAELIDKANEPLRLAKIFKRMKLIAERNFISDGDALHHLISHNKLADI